MPKKCNSPGCENNQFGGGFCLWHQRLRTDKKQVVKKAGKPIKKFSDKRKLVNLVYDREAMAFRLKNPFCRINSPDCIGKTQGVHHVKGKASTELLLDKNFWKAACNPCNLYVETHSQWAKDNGHKKNNHG